MTAATSVLLAVATELAQQAKSSMPEIREGERIQREWYENGVYCRETALDDKLFLSQYDFRQRKSRREAVVK
jgi:hypothetical protein